MNLNEIAIIIIIIIVNMIFVISEIALLTSSISKLEKYASNGSYGARIALKLLSTPNKMLSSVQVAITLLSMIIGLYGGTVFGDDLGNFLLNIPYFGEIIEKHKDTLGTCLAIVIMTYITVLSEIVPKRIAMIYPEQLAIVCSYVMAAFIFITYPFVSLLSISVQIILKFIRINEINTNSVSIDEIQGMIRKAENSGSIKHEESTMLRRFIDTGNLLVNSIMTPRKQVICLNIKDNIKVNIQKIKENNFANFPLLDGDFDHFVGFIPVRSLCNLEINKKIDNNILFQIAKKNHILYIPETSKVNKTIDTFLANSIKIAIVVDEYGEFEGVITLHDILKTFLGNIGLISNIFSTENAVDGDVLPNIISINNGCYSVPGVALMTEIVALLNNPSILAESVNKRQRTVASFMVHHIGEAPKVGDAFIINNIEFKVIKVRDFNIERAIIRKCT
ncbi:hemolysin family protein [Lyticum sinuosum]|uniref:HlyC/CorC family transporter n=1 Tax=Lyticum sinuosum TaxID=1332059 RepID=A0AAE4VKQ7_9RICK|nr:hemolysin family protein [Lyticum sinuosum]MDZ5761360.1 HlyC/CorC family transporter [Lyticum sinuosum]